MRRPLVHTVLPRPPHPTRDGLAIRNYHLLAGLAREFRVRSFVLLPPHLEDEPAEYPRDVDVELIPQAARSLRRAAGVGAALAGRAYSLSLYASRALRGRLAAEASREKPSWIVAQSYHVAPAAFSAGAPVWVDFHNVDSQIWRRLGETTTAALLRRFARSQAPRVARVEQEIARRAEGISCVSEPDAKALEALDPRASPLVVPNGVDLARYTPRTEAASEDVVFFVGDLTWAPNAEGVRWFARAVWPAVAAKRPRARAEVLGRGGEALGIPARDDFRVLGTGGDTRPHWRRAAVAVVPLFSGGGTRLKILEAAACGVPVVSTSIGAEGLSLRDGEDIVIRDDPEGFATAVVDLLSDRETSARLARAARARVEAAYDWLSIGARFAGELSSRAKRP